MATTQGPPPPSNYRRRSRSTARNAASAAALISALLVARGSSALRSSPPPHGCGGYPPPSSLGQQRQQQQHQRLFHRKRRDLILSSSSQLSLSLSSSSGSYGSGSNGGGAPCPAVPASSRPPLSSTDATEAYQSAAAAPPPPSSASTTLFRSATTTTASALKQREWALINNRRTTRRRRTTPLVDSDLLRFLGHQKQLLHKKQLLQQHHEDDEFRGYGYEEDRSRPSDAISGYQPSDASSVRADTTMTVESQPPIPMPTMMSSRSDSTDQLRTTLSSATNGDGSSSTWRITMSDGSPRKEEASAATTTTTTTTLSSSVCHTRGQDLGPFHAERVASVLLSKDETLDALLAHRAGDSVQAEALRRASRRQIRAFLRARDRQWLGGSGSAFGTATKIAVTPESGVEFPATWTDLDGQFQETVDLLMANNATHPYGLTGRDVCEVLLHTPSVALMRPFQTTQDGNPQDDDASATSRDSRGGETLQETLDRAMVLLSNTLKLRRYDARKVLRSCPGLLTQRGSRSADQMVSMLTTSLSVTSNSLARDKTGLPTLLRRSPSSLFRLVAFLASDAVRMPVSQIGPLIRQPKSQDLLNAVVPVWSLSSPSSTMVTDFDVDVGDSDDGTSLTSSSSDPNSWTNRQLLIQERRRAVNALYRNMTRTAWTLRNELGTADLGKVIASYPSVLLLDAETQVLEVAKFLMDELGIWKDDLSRVLQLYPVLLGMDVDRMRSVANYLSNDLEVSSDSLAIIFRSFPKLLALSIEDDIKPVVDFLQSEIGIANVGRFISRLPPVLGYSVEHELRPKWKFLERMVVDSRFEVTRFPAYFSYPLERVIKCRFEYLKKVKRMPIPLVSLDQVLRYGDRDFSTKVARDNDHGQSYAKFLEDRTKKSASAAHATTGNSAPSTTTTTTTPPSSVSIGTSSPRRPKGFVPAQQRP